MAANGTADGKTSADSTAQASQGTSDDKSPSLENLVPAISDAPKGQVTLGQNAGAFGPWRGHKIIDEIAQKIATATVKLLAEEGPPAPDLARPGADTPDPAGQAAPEREAAPQEAPIRTVTRSARVLVVSDRLLLPGDWSAGYVRSSLCRLKKRLAPLSGKLETEQEPLREAIAKIRTDEAEQPAGQRESEIGGQSRGGTDRAVPGAGSQPATSVPGVLSGALGDAVNLLGLLRTDYTITATAVTVTPSELSTLMAARLAEPRNPGDGKPQVRVTVEADAFATLGPTPSVELLDSVLSKRDGVVERMSELQAVLAPVQAELTAISARATSLEQAWASAVADKKDDQAIAQFQAALDGLAAQSARRQQATAGAVAAVAYAQQVVTDTDAALAALLQPSGTGEAPLLTAVRFERLDQAVTYRMITHVLYVNLDAVAADAVTRQSLLGTSGRISFLSSGNASWLLLNTTTGAIVGGGQESLAGVMTFSLETGEAKLKTVVESAEGDLGKDRLNGLEFWAKVFVVVFALALAALGVISFIAIVRIAFAK